MHCVYFVQKLGCGILMLIEERNFLKLFLITFLALNTHCHGACFWTSLTLDVEWEIANWSKWSAGIENEWEWTAHFERREIDARKVGVAAAVIIRKAYKKGVLN
jgi:hypothetical protein